MTNQNTKTSPCFLPSLPCGCCWHRFLELDGLLTGPAPSRGAVPAGFFIHFSHPNKSRIAIGGKSVCSRCGAGVVKLSTWSPTPPKRGARSPNDPHVRPPRASVPQHQRPAPKRAQGPERKRLYKSYKYQTLVSSVHPSRDTPLKSHKYQVCHPTHRGGRR